MIVLNVFAIIFGITSLVFPFLSIKANKTKKHKLSEFFVLLSFASGIIAILFNQMYQSYLVYSNSISALLDTSGAVVKINFAYAFFLIGVNFIVINLKK